MNGSIEEADCSKSDTAWRVLSWICLIICLCMAVLFFSMLPVFQKQMTILFKELGIGLPLPTIMAISMNPIVAQWVGAFIGVFAVLKEFLIRDLKLRLAINLTVFTGLIGLLTIYSMGLLLPVMKMQEALGR